MFKKGMKAWNKGLPSKLRGLKRDPKIGKKVSETKKSRHFRHTESTKLKISLKNKGIHTSPKTEFKKGHKTTHTEEVRKILSISKMGCKNPQWRGGITNVRIQIWRSEEYKLWRKAVFERDKYTCVWCGKTGGVLNADHIKPFALFPELRFAIDNGRTLCVHCHRKTDTYGGRTKVIK